MKLPTALALALDFVRMGLLSPAHFLGLALLAFAAVAAIVFMESARRHLSVQFPRRHLGGRAVGEASVQLPLKLNSAGVIPFVVGGWLMSVPALAALLMGDRTSLGFLTPGEPGFLLLSTMLIVFLAFFYTAFVLDPAAAAETLKRHGGAIAGVAPGEASAEHIDWVASRVTILGAAYLAAVVLIPAILFRYAGVPFYFGGISAMVVVCTVLDIKSRVREARALGA